ncbi:hypothetical protein [Streptomyces sp. NPDC055400]
MTNAFAMLRLLPMSDREKDVEILALRHQIGVDFTVDLGEPTGLSLSRSNFKNGLPPEWVTAQPWF